MTYNASYCCTNGSKKFLLPGVVDDGIQIPPSPTGIPPSTQSKLRAVSLGTGIGLGLPLIFILTACILFYLRVRRRRDLPTKATTVESNDDHSRMCNLEVVEVSGHREFELPPGTRSPTAEMPWWTSFWELRVVKRRTTKTLAFGHIGSIVLAFPCKEGLHSVLIKT